MKLTRRRFLQFAGAVAAAPALPQFASALDYPTRPVRILVGYTAGGAVDIGARVMGQWLSERLGQPFIVENRPGAGSNIATDAAIRATADGYTLLQGNTANTINATLYEKLNFDFVADVAPIAGVMRFPNVMQVNPSFPAQTVPEFIAYAKANPGKINVGSAGKGSSQHLSNELFKIMTGADLIHVPYRGAPQVLTDLIGGQVQVAFEALPASIALIKSGKLRALAVTTDIRSEALPEVPTIGEFVPGYEASGWNGLCAPKRTPTEIIEKLNKEINAGLADARLRAKISDFGGMPLGGSPVTFGKLIADETEKWAKVIRTADIKLE